MSITKSKVTIDDLIRMGFPIKRGRDYIPRKWLPQKPISLKEVHSRLSKIRGSVAEEICKMRDEF